MMSNENLRLVFLAGFAFCLLILWQRWEARDDQSIPATAPEPAVTLQQPIDEDLPTLTQDISNDTSDVPSASDIATSAAETPEESGRTIEVETDWLAAKISEDGGNLIEVALKKHFTEIDSKTPLPLIQKKQNRYFVAESGLVGRGEQRLPNHKSHFRYTGADTQITAGASPVTLTFAAMTAAIRVEKQYVFTPGSYLVDINIVIHNDGDESVADANGYFQFSHDGRRPIGHSSIVPSFYGNIRYTDENKFEKIAFDDVDAKGISFVSNDGWVGIVQRYYVGVWLLKERVRETYMRRSGDNSVRTGIITPLADIPGGTTATLSAQLYAGAQEQDLLNSLEDIIPGIGLSVDYGWLTFIAVYLFSFLNFIHSIVNNWGVAIILLTLCIKVLFFPLSAASYKSMARMKILSPEIQKIRERYSNDKQEMQKKMMELYREKKINPLGGCLPILVQIPVFIALYWVLLGSVEIRHAPFFLWINDLSAADPYFILPILLAITMHLQTKLSPPAPDPTMAMVMKIMPLFFAGISIFFPSGLVLYWCANTALTILQQWYITKKLTSGDVRS